MIRKIVDELWSKTTLFCIGLLVLLNPVSNASLYCNSTNTVSAVKVLNHKTMRNNTNSDSIPPIPIKITITNPSPAKPSLKSQPDSSMERRLASLLRGVVGRPVRNPSGRPVAATPITGAKITPGNNPPNLIAHVGSSLENGLVLPRVDRPAVRSTHYD